MKEVSEVRNIVQNSSSVKILKGLVISIIITLLLLFGFAALLTFTNIAENTIGPVVIAITGVSILAGSSMATSSIKKNGILNGGVIGFIYILLIYIASSITQSSFSLNMYSIVMIVASIITGMIGGVVGVNLK